MRILHEDRILTATGGNVSARLPGSNEVWITPSGVYKAELNPNQLIKIDLEGNIIEGPLKPSIETKMHLMIYKKRPDVNGIVHCHPPFSNALAICRIPIQPVTVTAIRYTKLRIVRYATPGSNELAELVADAISDTDVVLLSNHGLITVGRKLSDALYLAQCLEETAKVILAIHVLNRTPILIPEDEVKRLLKVLEKRKQV